MKYILSLLLLISVPVFNTYASDLCHVSLEALNADDPFPSSKKEFEEFMLGSFKEHAEFFEKRYFWSRGAYGSMSFKVAMEDISEEAYKNRFDKPFSLGSQAVLFGDRIYAEGFIRGLNRSGSLSAENVKLHPSMSWSSSESKWIYDNTTAHARLRDKALAEGRLFRGTNPVEGDLLYLSRDIMVGKNPDHSSLVKILSPISEQWELGEANKLWISNLIKDSQILTNEIKADKKSFVKRLLSLIHDKAPGFDKGYRAIHTSRSEKVSTKWARGSVLTFEFDPLKIPDEVRNTLGAGIEVAGAGGNPDIEVVFFDADAMLFLIEHLK